MHQILSIVRLDYQHMLKCSIQRNRMFSDALAALHLPSAWAGSAGMGPALSARRGSVQEQHGQVGSRLA